jgi:hypothetical protein
MLSALADARLAIGAPAPDLVVTARVKEATTTAVAPFDRPSFRSRIWSWLRFGVAIISSAFAKRASGRFMSARYLVREPRTALH